jgi:ribosomal protein S11
MTTKSKLLFLKSAGNYGFKTSRNRVSKQAFKVIFRELIKEIVSRKWSCLTIVYKGFRYKNFFLLDYLSQRGIKVNLVRNLIRLPYNGCRLKKYPRK